MKADFVVYDRHSQIVLIAELKRKTGVYAEWAAKWRRNILSHGDMPAAKFFLIALLDRFYLWKDAGNTPDSGAPTFEIDTQPILKPYLEESVISMTDISHQRFEFIVATWLNSILQIKKPLSQRNDPLNGIIQTGLSEAVSGGYLRHEVTL